MPELHIRRATTGDCDDTGRILEPLIRAGETYTLARSLDRVEALKYWMAENHEVFVGRNCWRDRGYLFPMHQPARRCSARRQLRLYDSRRSLGPRRRPGHVSALGAVCKV